MHPLYIEFVWRQLEFAFFGAVTLVAALFDFIKHRKERRENQMKNYVSAELEIIELKETDLICTSGTIGKDDGSNDGEWID